MDSKNALQSLFYKIFAIFVTKNIWIVSKARIISVKLTKRTGLLSQR